MNHQKKTHCSAAEAGYSQETLTTLDNHLQRLLKEKKITGGSYILARRGKIFASKTMGTPDYIEGKREFTPDSLRHIASVSKLFTNVALLQLMERGLLNFDQQVSDFIKEFDNDMFRHITVFDLITHTSGLKADEGSFEEPYTENINYEELTSENWIKELMKGPLQYKSGTTWNYSSFGYQVLAEVVAKVSEMDFDDYVIKNIFTPLGMEDTHYHVPEEKHSRVILSNKDEMNFLRLKKESFCSPSVLGGYGVYSTLMDIWKFAQMLQNKGTFNGKKVLGRKTVEAMTRKQVTDVPCYHWGDDPFTVTNRVNFGFGVFLEKHCFHSKTVYGYEGYGGTYFFVDPEEEFVYVGMNPDPEVGLCEEAWYNTLAVVWSGIE